MTKGLSPRVRGNPKRTAQDALQKRSIPARAGEPLGGAAVCSRVGVYPRACGGTDQAPGPRRSPRGLSPRVRGNPTVASFNASGKGSIPARAGEPWFERIGREGKKVYPRACGGTSMVRSMVHLLIGLSPRVRGNPQPAGPGRAPGGSIPARAGEPVRTARATTSGRVYPRACGGTWTG